MDDGRGMMDWLYGGGKRCLSLEAFHGWEIGNWVLVSRSTSIVYFGPERTFRISYASVSFSNTSAQLIVKYHECQ